MRCFFFWAFVRSTRGRRPDYGLFLWGQHPNTSLYERIYSRRTNIPRLVQQWNEFAELGICVALPLKLKFWVSRGLLSFYFLSDKWSTLNLVCPPFFWHCHVQNQIWYENFNKLEKNKHTLPRTFYLFSRSYILMPAWAWHIYTFTK